MALCWHFSRRHLFGLLVFLCVCTLILFCLKIRGSNLDRRHEDKIEAEIKKCAMIAGCQGTLQKQSQTPDEDTIMRNSSAGCPNAHRHGPKQKVISFVYYGNWKPWRHYFEGIRENAVLAAKHYPGWRIRIYHDLVDRSRWGRVLSLASCCWKNIDLCPLTPPLGKDKMLWRVLPIADSFVDVFISRDLDSRISAREVNAVNEWLSDDSKVFHLMRDHLYHKSLVMGGMWGAKIHKMRDKLTVVMQEMLTDRHDNLKDDQEVLKHYLTPHLQDNVLQHDSFYCKNFTYLGGMHPFPSQRGSEHPNFVGGVFFDYVSRICPPECRPPDKQDWISC